VNRVVGVVGACAATLACFAGCSERKPLAKNVDLGPTPAIIGAGALFDTGGHFTEVCVELPPSAQVDVHRHVVVLVDGQSTVLTGETVSSSGARNSLGGLSLLLAPEGRLACLDSHLPPGGSVSRVSLASAVPFSAPSIWWLSTDKF
jgi:hypothetical protein